MAIKPEAEMGFKRSLEIKACENRLQIVHRNNEHHNRMQLAAFKRKRALGLSEKKRQKIKSDHYVLI